MVGADHRDATLATARLEILRNQDALAGGQNCVEMRCGEFGERPAKRPFLDVACSRQPRIEVEQPGLRERQVRPGNNTAHANGIQRLKVCPIAERQEIGRQRKATHRVFRPHPCVGGRVHARKFDVRRVRSGDDEDEQVARPLTFRRSRRHVAPSRIRAASVPRADNVV